MILFIKINNYDRISNEALKSSGRLKQEVNNEQVQFCSSFNILLVTVLRESLLKQMDNGAFEPKKLKREKVKESTVIVSKELARECKE